MVFFVKYEFWDNYISEIRRKNIPLYLVSGIFRPDQHFFKWYGRYFRNMLKKFTHIFVQDERSVDLLRSINIKNVTLSGDTRLDRVYQISQEAVDLPVIENFRAGEKLFLAGSSWREDEEIISAYINSYPEKMKWVFAPHEVERANIGRLEKLFKTQVVRYSQYNENLSSARVLIIDNMGILASAYKYSYIASVGGGFGEGLHNILEPACWGVPVMIGPEFKKFIEAVELIKTGGAKSFTDSDTFKEILNHWLDNDINYKEASTIASDFVKKNIGATALILKTIL
jgi:3-deoxy-D-manno-octulosonic-acid transferase